jgi:hypothetical protein
LIDQRVLGSTQPTRDAFHALERSQLFRDGEHVEGRLAQAVQVRIERIEDLDNFFTISRTHTSDFMESYRQEAPHGCWSN